MTHEREKQSVLRTKRFRRVPGATPKSVKSCHIRSWRSLKRQRAPVRKPFRLSVMRISSRSEIRERSGFLTAAVLHQRAE